MTPVTNLNVEKAAAEHGGERRTVVICANSAWNLVNFRLPVIASLVADNHRVVAAAAPDGAESQITDVGAEFVALPVEASSRNPLADLRLLTAFIRLLGSARPDALMTFTIKPNIYGTLAARLTRTRALATVSGLGSAFLAGGLTGKLVDRLYRMGLARADAVFFQNDDDRDLFVGRGLIGLEQSRRVAGSGIDLDHFALAPPPANARPVFLFIGRLLWDKGVREFSEAARLVSRSGGQAEFRMLGECSVDNPSAVTLAEVERWAADGTINYLGPANDVRGAIAAADCIVLPSYREGLPRSLLEGAAMGRPLIATDVAGCRDVVDDGSNGFLCAPRSASALAGAIDKMSALTPVERRDMGLRARTKIEREFAVERVVAAYRTELGF